jgi:hypothetical protein
VAGAPDEGEIVIFCKVSGDWMARRGKKTVNPMAERRETVQELGVYSRHTCLSTRDWA